MGEGDTDEEPQIQTRGANLQSETLSFDHSYYPCMMRETFV